MKWRIIVSLLTVAIFFPFLINLLGWNIYTYFNFGEKDLILAAALGVSHNAWAAHYDDEADTEIILPDLSPTTILDVGFLNLFLERRGDPMTPFAFQIIDPDEYSDYLGFEFPWLLLFLFPSAIIGILRITK